MSSGPVVPSLLPLAGVKDPAIRAALQAIHDQLRVRNGEVGSGANRFLTQQDLVDEFLNAVGGGNGGRRGGSSLSFGRGGLNGAIQALVDKLTEELVSSLAWKALTEKIQWIETPEWFRGKFGGAYKAEQLIIEETFRAQATSFQTAVTNINGNIALARQEITAVSDATSANAQIISQVQTEVDGVQALAQEGLSIAQDATGKINGLWTVKFDLNGYIAGIALGVEKHPNAPPQSNFIIMADKFAIAAPGKTPYFPFVVNTSGSGPAVVVNGDMVVNGTITAQKIANNQLGDAAHGASMGSGASASISVTPGSTCHAIAVANANIWPGGSTPDGTASLGLSMDFSSGGYAAGTVHDGFGISLSCSAGGDMPPAGMFGSSYTASAGITAPSGCTTEAQVSIVGVFR